MKYILLGITQGLTEFLPISSSGHLYILKRALTIDADLLPFFTLLHIATLSAILAYLGKKIWPLFRDLKILGHIMIITIITASFGLVIDLFLKDLFENIFFIPLCLLINGGILLTIGKKYGQRSLKEIRLQDSLLLGVLQGLAVFPGISRSGITITGFIKRGFKAEDAFILSFSIAIPAIIGAFILKCKYLFDSSLTATQMSFGFFAAFICGIIALMIVKKTLINEKFSNFGYYCVVAALISLII